MGRNQARKKAQAVVSKASLGAIRRGHLGIYQKLQKALQAARERLAGRKELLQFDEIRRALDAKIEELTAALQDPSVADPVAISEGVYKLLRACQPLYLALNDGLSLEQACDALDDAERTLDDFADQDEKYKKHRKLNGGWVRQNGKWVKLNAKEFAAWQKEKKESNRKFEESPYSVTTQTTEKHDTVFVEQKRKDKKRSDKYARRTKKAKTEDNEPTPPNLVMRAMADGTKKYNVTRHLFKFAPAGVRNFFRPREEAMALAARCEANRPAGTTRAEQQAALAQEGRAPGVHPHRGHGYRARLMPKKKTYVTLKAPGGGFVFDTAAAAAEAIEKYEKAGSPTKPSDPLYDTLVDSVQRRK
ncbi:unnamed protein product [Pelagomonas calceolata]|uniref:Uncharacterized protein n=1 Tax=Pelagomonas calceolata TaxID=35677 RepID=A0A8J2WRU1_9STRA|nr:unnamed protein product [Pelagomonas calceolata]|mmetsp:Transcript_17741/g.54989  ORF Transcript_17741/g.54989 Transcript_17741/m.54989 type:complete len:360 (-) Transcript_17741:49-1128(-)